jgi:hypothetical protein
MDIFNWIGAASTLSLVGLCYKMANDKNGKYVPRESCEHIHKQSEIKIDSVRNILENKIIELKDDVIEIKGDIKILLLKK